MNNLGELFRQIPDTVVITDVFINIESNLENKYYCYHRVTSPVLDGKKIIGYTVLLTDITEEELLARQSRERSRELRARSYEIPRCHPEKVM